MEKESDLPFKVGDIVESRSFQLGFRGSWFRSKIREITKRQGRTAHILEYFDFPDEKLKCTRLYQVPPYSFSNVKAKRRELMLRPQYPPIYNEKEMRHVSDISEVTVIVHNSWKVGDLVDWWTTGCYWCGRITKLLGGDRAQIELHPPPLGEGASYEVSLKDCRPSLDWSPKHGWTLPTQEGETGRPCARLLNTSNQVSHSSNSAADSYKARSSETEKQSVGETVSNTEVIAGEEEKSTSSKSRRPCEGFALNSDRSDTLEAAIMDLEECVNKVKWLKRILSHGISSSEAERPHWRFVDSNPITETK